MPESESRVLEEIERRIAEERVAREIALSAQDHRLIPSIVALLRSLSSRSIEQRRERILASATAALWCLVPSPGAAAVGLVAIVSLLLTWQQARFLAIQNEKIEVQNLLSEAQRRSGLLFETTAIFQAIDEEKKSASKSVCESATLEPCWREEDGGRKLFVPSGATIGRIAALTQALRPYRYLSVEDARPYRFVGTDGQSELCPQKIQSSTLDKVSTLLRRADRGWADEDRRLRDPSVLKTEALKVYGDTGDGRGELSGTIKWIVDESSRLLNSLIYKGSIESDIALNCAPASPERGQILISLHAASVDVSRISARGGDFRYSDIPGAYLRGIILTDVDLSFSRFPGANFIEARLSNVSFSGAHLSGARFRGAQLSEVNFEGAVIQSLSDGAASAGPFTAGVAKANLMSGMRFVERHAKDDLHLRLCTAISLLSRFGEGQQALAPKASYLPMMGELARFGLLVETKVENAGEPAQLIGLIVPKLGDDQLVLYERGLPLARVEYTPFSRCNWPSQGHA